MERRPVAVGRTKAGLEAGAGQVSKKSRRAWIGHKA